MILSKWSITQQGNLFHAGSIQVTTVFRILVLDDHKLFRKAVTDHCIRLFFKNIELIEFENGDDAYEFIKNEIHNKSKIDLFITDINHPGLRGQELVKSIRFDEGLSGNLTRIPIIMLTMVDETRYPELVANNIVNYYLTKATEVEGIIDCIEEILYTT